MSSGPLLHLADVSKRDQGLVGGRPLLVLGMLAAVAGLVPVVHARVRQTMVAQRHLLAGVELANAGDAPRAEAEWTEALRAAPENPNAYRALGALYLSRGQFEAARRVLRELARRAPREEHTLCELAEAELRRASPADVRDAAEDASLAAVLEPDCFRARTVAGNAWVRLGDTARGIPHLQAALRLNPADVPLRQQLVRILLEDQQLAAATRAAEALTRRYPGYGHGYALLAACYQLYPPGSPEARQALGTARRCLALEPTNALAHAEAGKLLLRQERAREALPHLEAARVLNPRRTSTLFDLSRAYQAVGRPRDAEELRKQFRRRSDMENELAALEKRQALHPEDRLVRRIRQLTAALGDRTPAARMGVSPVGQLEPGEEAAK